MTEHGAIILGVLFCMGLAIAYALGVKRGWRMRGESLWASIEATKQGKDWPECADPFAPAQTLNPSPAIFSPSTTSDSGSAWSIPTLSEHLATDDEGAEDPSGSCHRDTPAATTRPDSPTCNRDG